MTVAEGAIAAPSTPRVEPNKLARATQWQLIRWRFMSHRVAVFSLGVIVLLYLTILFAEFIAPYDPNHYDVTLTLAPPQRIHFVDNGQFQWRPFVYGYTS
jgi:peptide/nickel transport system permease protein